MKGREDLVTRLVNDLASNLKSSKSIREMGYRSLFSEICEILDNDVPKSKEIQNIVDIVSQQEIIELRKKKNAFDYGAIWASIIMYDLTYSEIYNQPKSNFGIIPKATDQLIKKICDEMFEINGQLLPVKRKENARTEISPLSSEQFNALFKICSEYIHYIREKFRGNHIDCEIENYWGLNNLFSDTNVMYSWFDEVSLATWKTAFDFGAIWAASQLMWHFERELEYKREVEQTKEWINQKNILIILDKICNNEFITDLEIIDWYVKEYNNLTKFEVRQLLIELKIKNVVTYFKNFHKINEQEYERNDTCIISSKWKDIVREMIEQQKK